MTDMMIKDLEAAKALDAAEMSEVRGGLSAVVDNSQQANQHIVGGYGPIHAINAPVSAPSTVLTESNPYTVVNLNSTTLVGSHQNVLASLGF